MSSLLGGYHLAFLVGIGAIVVGIVVAFALLRSRGSRGEAVPASSGPIAALAARRLASEAGEIGRQAA